MAGWLFVCVCECVPVHNELHLGARVHKRVPILRSHTHTPTLTPWPLIWHTPLHTSRTRPLPQVALSVDYPLPDSTRVREHTKNQREKPSRSIFVFERRRPATL